MAKHGKADRGGAATAGTARDAVRLTIDLGRPLPPLDDLSTHPGSTVRTESQRVTVRQYDTAAGDLLAAGVELSRFGSGGWLVGLHGVDGPGGSDGPGDGTTTASGDASTGRGVPVELRDLLLGVRAGRPLRVAGRLESSSTIHTLASVDGIERCVVADVTIDTAASGGAGVASLERSRRLEVSGEREVVRRVVRRLRRAGASRSVARASGPRLADATTVGEALRLSIDEQRREMLRADVDLRRGRPAVHAMRVAIRRIRSEIRAVAVTEASARAALDVELRWLSGVLGEVRDREVLAEALDALLDRAEPAVRAAADGHLRATLERERDAAAETMRRALNGRRYLELVQRLRDWSVDPPLTDGAARPVTDLVGIARAAARQVGKRLDAAHGSVEGLHRARKAAKRARYVAELATGALGSRAGAAGAAAGRSKTLQTRLGEHQDLVVAAAFLRRAAEGAEPGTAFAIGAIWAEEMRRAEKLERRLRR